MTARQQSLLVAVFFTMTTLVAVLPVFVLLPQRIVVGSNQVDLTLSLPFIVLISIACGMFFARANELGLRQRAAWIFGIAAIASVGASYVLGFDGRCRQVGYAYCEWLEPPISQNLTISFGLDGEAAEDFDILQMWLVYWAGFALLTSTLAWIAFRLSNRIAIARLRKSLASRPGVDLSISPASIIREHRDGGATETD